MSVKARPTLVFATNAWKSPSSVTNIQGMVRDPETGDYFITQARNVRGQSMQNVVIRRHHANLKYVDRRIITKGGHASSIGVEQDGRTMIWLGHKAKGTGRFSYDSGQNSFQVIGSLPKEGDISVHGDVACIRNGHRYRGYRLSDAKSGRTTKLFDFRIPRWAKTKDKKERFQGHVVVSQGPDEGLVLVHRDVGTKKESRAMAFTFTGDKVAEIDTTDMGDEAEGFLVEEKNGSCRVWVVKRTGRADKKRTVVATLWLDALTLAPIDPVITDLELKPTALATEIAAVFRRLGVPKALKAASTIKAARGGYVSRYTYYVQRWLIALDYYHSAHDGKWGTLTQKAYDEFRSNIRPEWPPQDLVGLPGITSLTLLRNAAVKATLQDQLPVLP
ncbi:hypothetical protein [Microlunatus phosphovorus]|uniref:hypothetical protein n=1 Tax=Microlunatus phosphovorus TaxID=29405 RepID=UPI0012E9C48E|nr:hypothetical protein [Microlunatus phosphovorus]